MKFTVSSALAAVCIAGAAGNAAAGSKQRKLLTSRYLTVAVGTNTCDVMDYGAKGDGKSDDADAIQKAIDDCAKEGGQVLLSLAGKSERTYFIADGLEISGSHVEFTIEKGVTLLVSDDIKHWPKNKHIISAENVEQIAFTGGGVLDGQGKAWWRAMEQKGQKDMFRPHTVDTSHVTGLLMQDITFRNGPNHILELGANFAELDGIQVLNPASPESHNTDAVDVHGQPFYVHNVFFDTGDDNIAGHANDTLVEDSTFGSGHGASIGSLCDDYLTNITFRNITFLKTTAGARIKSHPDCGGHVWDVTYEDLTMTDVTTPIDITQYYDGTGSSTYLFEDITFKNINVRVSDAKLAGSPKPVVNFDCDTHYDGKANCHNFVLENYVQDESAGDMFCHGVQGKAENVKGISSCL